MKSMKKIMMMLFAMFSLVLAMQFSVSAATKPAKVSKSDFNIMAEKGELTIYYKGDTRDYNSIDIEVKNLSTGKTKIYNTKYLKNTIDISNRVAYRVRIRGVWNIGTTKVVGEWSSAKYDVQVSAKLSLGKNTTFNLKLYSAKGVKNYTVYISKKEKSGFKKVGTYAVSGKTKTINIKKCGSSKIKRYVRYYVKIVPNVKVGSSTEKTDSYLITNGYIYLK